MRRQVLSLLTPVAFGLAVACGVPDRGDDDAAAPSSDAGTSVDAGAAPDAGPAVTLCEPVAISCEDELVQELNLRKDPAPGVIENESDGTDWSTFVDATAGGAFTSSPHSYVYGKFDPDSGLVKVALGDEAALESMDWDIAFRRYVMRINSGDSGPGCVRAARMPPSKTYEDVTAIESNIPWRIDDYFGESCDFIPDGSGLPSAPASALSSYWSYDGCVKMTGNVFVVELRDGRHVKVQVKAYYGDAQSQCDERGTSPTTSARMKLRWAFVD